MRSLERRSLPRLAPAFTLWALLLWVPAWWILAQPTGPDPDPATPSPRNANYEIDARLDPDTRLIDGRQIVTWRNTRDQPTDELWFHLYWNGFRNDQSTWWREDRLRGRSDIENPTDEDWGYLDVDRVRLLDQDLAQPQDLAIRFESPDDGNPHDRTVMVVDLPGEVAPGETVRVELEWRSRVPHTFARTGNRGEFYFIAHWFPQLGVFEPEGWNCHQFHSATEFYADYGSYDVRLTLPERFVVGATGRVAERQVGDDGTVTHRYRQDDVHGFTWTASPDYLEATARFAESGLPPVDMRLLYQGEHADQVERYFEATRAALKYYGTWYGAYPYGHVTIVDPAFQAGAGGMEYPTIFTGGTRISRPFGGTSPESVVIHEAGHQFWYGLVGNNEIEFAWLDEGLNTFSTARTYEAAFGDRLYRRSYLSPPGTNFGGFISVVVPDAVLSRAIHGNGWSRFVRSTAAADVMADPTYLYYPGSASSLSYSKTAVWLATLERYLGWETLQRILSTFFERWKFAHPKPEDFFAVANEVSGRDLTWYFDQVHGSAVHFDYAVDSVKSSPAEAAGFVDPEDGHAVLVPSGTQDEDSGATELYRSEVVVRRHGLGVFPLELLLVFEDGSEKRFDWDGKEPWKVFTEERASKLEYAALDPERVLLLDTDYSNNSRLMKSQATFAARKWASKWMVWMQDFLHTFTFFI